MPTLPVYDLNDNIRPSNDLRDRIPLSKVHQDMKEDYGIGG
jgi:hypothetical protein